MSKGFYQMPYPENELVRNYERMLGGFWMNSERNFVGFWVDSGRILDTGRIVGGYRAEYFKHVETCSVPLLQKNPKD